MTPKERLILAGRRQAHERADREGKPMLVWYRAETSNDGYKTTETVYVRAEGGDSEFQPLPLDATLVDRIMPGTEL